MFQKFLDDWKFYCTIITIVLVSIFTVWEHVSEYKDTKNEQEFTQTFWQPKKAEIYLYPHDYERWISKISYPRVRLYEIDFDVYRKNLSEREHLVFIDGYKIKYATLDNDIGFITSSNLSERNFMMNVLSTEIKNSGTIITKLIKMHGSLVKIRILVRIILVGFFRSLCLIIVGAIVYGLFCWANE